MMMLKLIFFHSVCRENLFQEFVWSLDGADLRSEAV